MSGLEWFLAILSAGLMLAAFWFRAREDQAMQIRVCHRRPSHRLRF